MQVALGRKGDYAVRAMLYLARHGQRGKSREIAAEMDVPGRYLPQILVSLVRAGLLTAMTGRGGGYQLTRDPAQITLLEVVESAEGSVRVMQCILRGGPRDWEQICPVHEAWSRAQEALVAELARTTFAELARKDREIESGEYGGEFPASTHSRPRRGARRD